MRYICMEFVDSEFNGYAVNKLENFLNDNEIRKDEIVSISSSCNNDLNSIITLVYFR